MVWTLHPHHPPYPPDKSAPHRKSSSAVVGQASRRPGTRAYAGHSPTTDGPAEIESSKAVCVHSLNVDVNIAGKTVQVLHHNCATIVPELRKFRTAIFPVSR